MKTDDSITTKILMNINLHETRIAIIENGTFKDIKIQRNNSTSICGNIYKGKVLRVLNGMQSAFIDIGLNRTGFLHLSDVLPLKTDNSKNHIDLSSEDANIKHWLRQGQSILVQVLKDPIGTKGARLTAHLSLPARNLVFMPDIDHIGISMKIEAEEKRLELQSTLKELLNLEYPRGYIVRTIAENATKTDLNYDIVFLERLWDKILDNSSKIKIGLIHSDLTIEQKIIRDYVNDNIDRVKIDNLKVFNNLVDFAEKFIPDIIDKLVFYDGSESLFNMYGIEKELQTVMSPTVQISSGASIVIEQTEAMITIDVNSGKYTGGINHEETIFKVNLQAAKVISKQIRLRSLGGIIVIDFIDMTCQDHIDTVIQKMQEYVSSDIVKCHIYGISQLGLMQMTRKRTQKSLAQQLCDICENCSGVGYIKSIQTTCYDIFRDIQQESKIYSDTKGFLVLSSLKVIEALRNQEADAMAELEIYINKPIKLGHLEQYNDNNYTIALI